MAGSSADTSNTTAVTAAIPLEMVEDVALVGPPDKIRDEMAKWKETCLTTVLLSGQANQLEFLAALVNG